MTERQFYYKFVLTGQCIVRNLIISKVISRKAFTAIKKFNERYLTTPEANAFFPTKTNHVPNLEKRNLIKAKTINKVTNNGNIKLWKKDSIIKLSNSKE
jgi:hypothetical protein